MKKLILIFILFSTANIFGQFTVAKTNGDPINNNDVYTFNTTTYAVANLEFIITNTSNHEIDVVITVESITNTNGSQFEVCLGSCYSSVIQGNSYPNNQPYGSAANTPFHLEVGANSGAHGNHFYNYATGSSVITYVVKFHEVDANGVEIGTPVRMSYVYDENAAGINDDIFANTTIFPNPAKGQFTIANAEGFNVSLYSVLGKEVLRMENLNDNEIIPTSRFAEGAYLLKIYNDNSSLTKKLIIIK